ncbi:hypothetical protein [Sediminibacterium sp.]|uniref:hypothetical protein n=1 Tax=Sediminibacterium sp. TaxID=1917865 RepID=UPI003F6F4117
MMDNPVDIWYLSDERLKKIIDTLSLSEKSPFEQAKEAFYQISELYNLHKYPDDITEDDYRKYEDEGLDNPRTVFEEVGIIRYLEPEDDPRGVVLFALYNIKNRTYIDISFCAEKHFGSRKKVPDNYVVYFTGQDADSKLNFLNAGESWTKEGVKYASKILHRV